LFVRRSVRGKVRPVLIRKNMFANQASALGRRITNRTPARTYFIRIVKGKPKRIASIKTVSPKKFRSPKGKTQLQLGSRVERSKFLIDTKGEKRGITRKGINAPRRKKVLKRKKIRRRPVRRLRRRPVRRIKRKAKRVIRFRKKRKR